VRGLNPDKARAIEIANRDAFWTKLSPPRPVGTDRRTPFEAFDPAALRVDAPRVGMT